MYFFYHYHPLSSLDCLKSYHVCDTYIFLNPQMFSFSTSFLVQKIVEFRCFSLTTWPVLHTRKECTGYNSWLNYCCVISVLRLTSGKKTWNTTYESSAVFFSTKWLKILSHVKSAFSFPFNRCHLIFENANVRCEHRHLLQQNPFLNFWTRLNWTCPSWKIGTPGWCQHASLLLYSFS